MRHVGGIDAERRRDRREQVRHGHRVLHDLRAVRVGLAVDDAAANARAGEHRAPRARVVIASVVAVDVRRAAEVAHPHHERAVGEPATLRDPRAAPLIAGIERAHQLLRAIEVVLVRVPAVERHLDEAHAGRDEPRRRETAAPEAACRRTRRAPPPAPPRRRTP